MILSVGRPAEDTWGPWTWPLSNILLLHRFKCNVPFSKSAFAHIHLYLLPIAKKSEQATWNGPPLYCSGFLLFLFFLSSWTTRSDSCVVQFFFFFLFGPLVSDPHCLRPLRAVSSSGSQADGQETSLALLLTPELAWRHPAGSPEVCTQILKTYQSNLPLGMSFRDPKTQSFMPCRFPWLTFFVQKHGLSIL